MRRVYTDGKMDSNSIQKALPVIQVRGFFSFCVAVDKSCSENKSFLMIPKMCKISIMFDENSFVVLDSVRKKRYLVC